MKNCEICKRPTGTQYLLVLEGKYNDEGHFVISDAKSIVCSSCWNEVTAFDNKPFISEFNPCSEQIIKLDEITLVYQT